MLRWIRKVFVLILFIFFFSAVVFRHFDLVLEAETYSSNRINEETPPKNYSSYKECWNDTLTTKFKNIRQTRSNVHEIRRMVNNMCLATNNTCPEPNLIGYIGVDMNITTINDKSIPSLNLVHSGGWWAPYDCYPNKRSVAVVIPFRAREEHLPILIRHLHPILQRQLLHYRIFVVKQDEDYSFNKGMLVNAGIKEILQIYPYECIVLQDVDLVPEDDRIDYSCSQSPMHMAGRIDKYDYVPLPGIKFGGVVSMWTKHYIQINGFSNLFWQWGGEDDNMFDRTDVNKLKYHTTNVSISKYTMLKHESRMFKRKEDWKETHRIMRMAKKHWDADGYNSVVYRVNKLVNDDLVTTIEFNLVKESLTP